MRLVTSVPSSFLVSILALTPSATRIVDADAAFVPPSSYSYSPSFGARRTAAADVVGTATTATPGRTGVTLMEGPPRRESRNNEELEAEGGDDDSSDSGNKDGFMDCNDGEECEIDWGAMPSEMDDPNIDASLHRHPKTNDRKGNKKNNKNKKSNRQTIRCKGGGDGDGEKDRVDHAATERARLSLEMMWSLEQVKDECDAEHPESCGSQPCRDCRGRGVCPCRFCRGNGKLAFLRQSHESEESPSVPVLMACPNCQNGVTVCQTCKGSGWVAEWTTLGTQHTTP